MKFLDILRREAPTTAEELAAALAEAEQAALDADARVEALTAERGRLLLDGDDKAIDRIEAQLATAARDSDRASLAAGELKRRLAAATDAERQAELDRAYEAGTAAQARGIEALTKKYEPLARKLAAVLAEVDAAEVEVARHRAALETANDPRRKELIGADRAARPLPEGRPPLATIVQIAELPALAHGELLWPPTTTADQVTAAGGGMFQRLREAGSQYVDPALRLKTLTPEDPYFPVAHLRRR